MTTPACPSYAGYRFPAEVISHETVRQWALKFGQGFANQIRRRLPGAGDKWHMDGVSRTQFLSWNRGAV